MGEELADRAYQTRLRGYRAYLESEIARYDEEDAQVEERPIMGTISGRMREVIKGLLAKLDSTFPELKDSE